MTRLEKAVSKYGKFDIREIEVDGLKVEEWVSKSVGSDGYYRLAWIRSPSEEVSIDDRPNPFIKNIFTKDGPFTQSMCRDSVSGKFKEYWSLSPHEASAMIDRS